MRDVINHLKDSGRLFWLTPLFDGEPQERTILVSEQVKDVIGGPWADDPDGKRFARLRADVDRFTRGDVVSFRWEPYGRERTAYMARLDRVSDGIVEIRSFDPSPSLRLLGGFSEQDVFVGLTWEWRVNLGGPGSREWNNAIERCKAEWRKLFHPYTPYVGNSLHDYISRKAILV
jgi:hypothetical protein